MLDADIGNRGPSPFYLTEIRQSSVSSAISKEYQRAFRTFETHRVQPSVFDWSRRVSRHESSNWLLKVGSQISEDIELSYIGIPRPLQTSTFRNSFLPLLHFKGEGLKPATRSARTLLLFQKTFKFIRPVRPDFYGVNDTEGKALLTRHPVGFSDLHGHRFRCKFYSEKPLSACLHENESTGHFVMRCRSYITQSVILSAKHTQLRKKSPIYFWRHSLQATDVWQ